jgi:hypothetical protein
VSERWNDNLRLAHVAALKTPSENRIERFPRSRVAAFVVARHTCADQFEATPSSFVSLSQSEAILFLIRAQV